MVQCDFCGRFRDESDDPHQDRESCPYKTSHDILQRNQSYPDDTLFEAVANTVPGDSISLRAWGQSYPVFRPVYECRTWIPTSQGKTPVDRGTEVDVQSYWKKSIWTRGKDDTLHCIEYDPSTQSLIDWYTVTETGRTKQSGQFGVFLRMESPDVSYFGSTLPM